MPIHSQLDSWLLAAQTDLSPILLGALTDDLQKYGIWVAIAILILLALVILVAFATYGKLWLQSYMSGRTFRNPIPIKLIILMSAPDMYDCNHSFP